MPTREAHLAHSPGSVLSARMVLAPVPELLAVVLFVALIWIAIFGSLRNERLQAQQDAFHQSSSLAHAYADNAQRVVGGIDQMLLALRSRLADDPAGFDLAAWALLQNPSDRLRVQVAIIDADGFLSDSTAPDKLQRVNLSDREHFHAQLDAARDDLFISRPVLGRLSGRQAIQFSRKLLRRDSTFAGVAVISIGCDELARFYQSIDLTGVIVLLGYDGIVRARSPVLAEQLGRDFRAAPDFGRMLATPRGSLVTSLVSNAEPQTVGFEHLESYPLLVLVGVDSEAVLAGYRATRVRSVAIGALVSVMVGLLGVFWVVQRRKSAAFQRDLELTLESMSQGIVMIDPHGRIPVMNRRAAELLAVHVSVFDACRGRFATEFAQVIPAEAMREGTIHRGDKVVEVQSRRTLYGGRVLTYSDVTERAQHEEKMVQLAHFDALTGLANRVLLDTTIQELLRKAERRGGWVGIIALDLDGFKLVNDDLGHETGDRLLVEVADRLVKSVRPSDTVARIGGDEFIVVVDGTDSDGEASSRVIERIAQGLIGALVGVSEVCGHSMRRGASAGSAEYPTDGLDQTTLIRRADTALYAAKAAGRGLYSRFEPVMGDRLSERRWLEAELRMGLANGDVEVHYQPQFRPDSLMITGFEALARWRHPQRGLIFPGVFVPIAEECGLIIQIGRQVLQDACTFAASLPSKRRVAVNLSPVQFRDASFPVLVAETLRSTGLPAAWLELEITEGVLIQDEDQAVRTFTALRALGISIALDDFGTGYSSLNYLRRFSFDRVKIDKSFVQADDDERTVAILDAVLALSARLSLAVTVEGVETEAQLEALRTKPVGEIQGFLLGRPMPAGEARRLLARTEIRPIEFSEAS